MVPFGVVRVTVIVPDPPVVLEVNENWNPLPPRSVPQPRTTGVTPNVPIELLFNTAVIVDPAGMGFPFKSSICTVTVPL